MVRAGIKAIWNFAPVDIKVPPEVILENEHLADRLMVISFRLKVRFRKTDDKKPMCVQHTTNSAEFLNKTGLGESKCYRACLMCK